MLRRLSHIVCLFLLLVTTPLRAQWGYDDLETDSWMNTEYNTTEGKEFWVTFMRNSGSSGQDNRDMFLYLYATSRENAKVTITKPNSYASPVVFNVRAGKQDSCLVPNEWAYIEDDKEVSNFAVKVTSDKPIALYATNQHSSGKYDATNILPTNALMGEYVIQTYQIDQYSTEFAIVATRSQYVTINLQKTTIDIQEYETNGKVVVTSTDTETIPLWMYAGQTYLYRSASDDGSTSSNRATSLSGTTICSDYPLAVFIGGQSAKVPSDPENHIFSQQYPTDKWGKTFYVTPTHGMVYDYVQFTACKDGTKIYRNGDLTPIATINAKQSYIDTVKSQVYFESVNDMGTNVTQFIPNVVKYTTSEVAECFLYGTSYTANHPTFMDVEVSSSSTKYGAPVLTPIIPQELAMRSTMFATFTKTNTDLKHFVNIVTPTSEKNGMRLDGVNISGEFQPIPNSTYSYVIKEVSSGAHKLENVGGKVTSTFTARVYGMGMSSSSKESYAYAAGSRVSRKSDLLINNRYIKETTICVTQSLNFKGLIEGDYTSYRWDFKDPLGEHTGTGLEQTHRFSSGGDYEVEFIVTRPFPYLCSSQSGSGSTTVEDHVTAIIHVKDRYDAYFDRKICEGESVTLRGRDENGAIQEVIYNSNVTEDKHFFTIDGCDSIVHVKVEVGTPKTKNISHTECNQYTWHGTTYQESGTYTWVGKTAYNCDSTEILDLTIIKPVKGPVTEHTICANSTYPWNGQNITKEGTYTATLKAANGCDSIATLHVQVEELHRDEQTVKKCFGDSYQWRGRTLTEADTYTDHSLSPNGCDSTFILHLSFYPDYTNIPLTAEICEGESYPFGDQTLTESGTYTRNLTTTAGCDSILHLTLTVNPVHDTILYDTICDSSLPYKWTVHNNYTNRNQTVTITRPASEAQNVWHATWQANLQTFKGCDSIVHLDLIVYPKVTNEVTLTLCPEQLPYQYCENGATMPVGATTWNKTETIPSRQFPMACDSVITYHITVSAENIQPITVRRCDDNLPYSYDYPALPAEATHTRLLTDIRETGIYDDTVSIAGQCRTIYRLNFTVDKTYDDTLSQVDVCINNLPYSWRVTDKKGNSRTIYINIPDDKVLPFDTLCTANLKSIHDCDSIVRLPLRVHPTYTTQVYDTICQKSLPYTWRDSKGTSLRQIRLTDIRTSEQWKDPDWTYTTDYNHHSQYNCDSLLTLHLTVYPTLTNEVTITLCPEQLPYQYCENGATVPVGYTGGDITETIPSKQFSRSCDSVITYHINVSAENIVPISVTQCNNEPPYSYDYGSEPAGATHRHRLENLKTSGVYRDTVEVEGQCRTIYELHLTVNDTTKSEQTYYLCEGDTYTDIDFPTIKAKKDTAFVKRLEKANAVSCDSVVYVTVKFGKKYEDPTSAVVLCEREKSYLWETSDTYQATPYRHLLTWGDLHELVLDTTLTDTLHTASPFYCDSIVSLHVTVNPTTIHDMTVTWCASAGPYSYGEKGKQATETAYYIDTLITKNHYGCDSVLHLHFEWKDSIYFHDTVRICDNKALEKHDKLYIGDKYAAFGGTYDASRYDSVRVYPVGQFRDTIRFRNSIGCDSSFYIVVEVQPTHYSDQERNVCQFADVTYEAMHNGLGGSVPTDVLGDVEFMDTIPSLGNGCDSVIHMTYHIRPHYHFSQGEIALCQTPGSTWIWYNEHGDQEGSISLSEGDKTYHLGKEYSTIYGCDSTYGITVYVAPIYHYYDTIPLCENDSAHWHNMLFTGSQYTAYGKTYDPTPFDSIKTNLSHGTYHVDIKHQTVYDCDSIYHLTLYVHEVAHTDSLDSVCQGHPFHNPNWNRGEGMYMNTDRVGTYISVDTIPSKVTGCDSIVTLTLRVDSVYDYRPYFEFCQDTIHTDTIVEWRDEAGKQHTFTLDISKAGTFSFTDAYTSIHGCDSIFGVSWFVHPIYRFDSTYVICQSERVDWQHKGYSGDRYGWGYDRLPGDRYDTHRDVEYYHYRDGDSILAPGVYYDTAHYYSTEFGCDSTFYLKLIVQPGGHYIRNEVACGDEKYHVFYTSDAYGQHTDTIFFPPITRMLDGELKDTMYYEAERRLTAVNGGCDSIIHFHLTVHPSYEYVKSARICWGGSYEWRGGKYYSTGVYYDSIQGGTDYWHCDSVYVLELYVKPVVIIPHYDTICDNETYQHLDTLWYTNGTQSYVETMVWTPGMQIPQDYTEVYFKGKDGCDSIIYRYWLQINKTYLFDETANLCSNETYKMEDGHLFSGLETEYEIGTPVAPKDTTFIHSYQTVHGCDSVYQLHATVYPAYRHRDTITICDDGEAVWREHTYRGSMYGNVLGDGYPAGEHVFHDTYHTHDQGCDSIYELHLMVMPTYLFEEHLKKCADEDMTWHGHNLDHLAVGTYFFHDSAYTAVYGCDSVHHLYLTVNDTTREVLPDTICYPEVYDFHGKPLTEAGYYYDTTLNEWGCHHFTHLYLEVIDPTVPTARVDSICADDDAYDLFYTYTGDYDPIAYSVKYDEEGHRNGFEDIIDHPITTPDELSWLRIPMPNIEADRTGYPRPDYYRIKLVLDNGICTNPDLCSTDTTIVLSYPSWITQQRFGDVIALYNDTYNGGYHWSHYQWYHGDKPIPGETHEYLYVPTGLVVGDQYHVRLTRDGEVQDFQTCPITIVANPVENDFAPEKGYLSVVPTCVCNCNPYINILSRKDGTYRITTATGRLVSQGVFRADVTQVPVPVLEGIYIVQLWSNDTPEEPYRSIKILVSSKCTPEHYENIPF